MNIKELKDMINLMNEHGLTELELEKDDVKIKLKKGSSGAVTPEIIAIPPGASLSPTSQKPWHAQQASPAEPVDSANVVVVRSPMVGTFYAAPAPDQEPYVAKGQQVSTEDVLCIIEAMKLMNEIKSEVTGRVSDILVENGQAVEFDQPLFKIEKG